MRFLLGLCLVILQACLFQTKDERVAGGAEDFPNTIVLGAAVSGHISDQADWDQFSSIPSTLPSLSESDSLIIAPDSTALAKTTGVISDTIIIDKSDTLTLGVVRRIHLQENILKIHRDTTVYRYDAKAKDNIIGNEHKLLSQGTDEWKISGRITTYLYQNLDSSGAYDRGTFFEHLPALGSTFKDKRLIMLAGPDGDVLSKSDNRPTYFSFAQIKQSLGLPSDTLESFEITDADGDGTLWGQGDSGIVNYRQKQPNPLLRPSVSLISQDMRAVLFKDELKTYPIAFQESRIEKDGKTVKFSVKGPGPDSVFSPGDSVWISVDKIYAPESRLVQKHTRYLVILGSQPKHYQDNKLLRFTLEASWQKDSLFVTRLIFTPDQPVFSKELSQNGNLEIMADFANGESAIATGRYQDKHIEVELTRKFKDGKEKRLHILWDALGRLLSQAVRP
jgi:hypothetical protein